MFWLVDMLLDNVLIILLIVLGIIVGGMAITNLKKKDNVKGGIFGGLTALIFAVIMVLKQKDGPEHKKQIKELDKKIKDKKDEIKEIDKEMEENKKKAEELEKKEKEIVDALASKLKKAENIQPTEVETDEDVLDAFGSMYNRANNNNTNNV